ncbi:MAG: hypothetical protein WCP33_04880 [Deltaproteobacteria bacterium]
MPKIATISELEHHIELLKPEDQLQLLEKMVHHLKRTLTGRHPAKVKKNHTVDYSPVRGALKQYANPTLRELESAAFPQAMQAKHAFH